MKSSRLSHTLTPSVLKGKNLRTLFWVVGLALLFVLYIAGISHNPPGFYVDESATAYNAYLVSRTGAGEFGPRFPLYFQTFTSGFAGYIGPILVYLLAFVFWFVPPSILTVRIFAAFWVFAACLLLGLLARRISGERQVGIIVAVTALLTPWFFEMRGLVWEPQFLPMALTLFLLAVYRAHKKESWNWLDVFWLAVSGALLTYSYASGRVLGPLLVFGLFWFAITRQRLIGVVKTWLLYGALWLPLLLFNRQHPAGLVRRLYEVSYIRPGVPWREIAPEFVARYLEDQSLAPLLLTGDHHARHHVPGSGGAIFLATFVLAMMGLLFVVARGWRDPWWRFVVLGLALSIVPGAITNEPFHELRLMAYPVFLLLLNVPALEWLLGSGERSSERPPLAITEHGLSRPIRFGILGLLLALTVLQAAHFQIVFRREGPKREFDFDVPYKAVYDAAIAQPTRPIYLEDGMWGPAYMHALWYATVEGRPRSEFVHLAAGVKPPKGAIVISSADNCQNCEITKRSGVYRLYRAK